MSDESSRSLERSWLASGNPADGDRYLADRFRSEGFPFRLVLERLVKFERTLGLHPSAIRLHFNAPVKPEEILRLLSGEPVERQSLLLGTEEEMRQRLNDEADRLLTVNDQQGAFMGPGCRRCRDHPGRVLDAASSAGDPSLLWTFTPCPDCNGGSLPRCRAQVIGRQGNAFPSCTKAQDHSVPCEIPPLPKCRREGCESESTPGFVGYCSNACSNPDSDSYLWGGSP